MAAMASQEWATAATAQVATYLDREDVQPQLLRLVAVWNDLELLGVDLADQIEKMVRNTAGAGLELGDVDWNQLAEHYALQIAAVDEAELTRRRVKLSQGK